MNSAERRKIISEAMRQKAREYSKLYNTAHKKRYRVFLLDLYKKLTGYAYLVLAYFQIAISNSKTKLSKKSRSPRKTPYYKKLEASRKILTKHSRDTRESKSK